MECFAEIVANAISGEIAEEKIKMLHTECSKFTDKEIKKLEKIMKL